MQDLAAMGLVVPALCWGLLDCIFGSAGAAPFVEPTARGDSNPSLAALSFPPSPWRTGGGLGIMLLFVAVLLFSLWLCISRERLRRAVERNRQQSLEDERARIARDMHDGLGANLVKIALLGEIIDGDRDDGNLRANVGKMVKAARESVRAMDQIVWAVDPRNDSIENLATYLCQFAREHFEIATILLNVDVPAELPPGLLSAEKRYQLFLAAKEVMTNIVKHAHATEVSMNIRLDGSNFVIVIRDNGCGLPAMSATSRGRGRSNLRERLAAVGGNVECSSKPDEGTEFILSLPLSGN